MHVLGTLTFSIPGPQRSTTDARGPFPSAEAQAVGATAKGWRCVWQHGGRTLGGPDVDLSCTSFWEIGIGQVDLRGADLRNTVFLRSNLVNSNLSGANLDYDLRMD